MSKYHQLRADQAYLEEAIAETEWETQKSRKEHIGDVSLAGEGILGMVFDALGFNDGIEGYGDED